jgi:hypothetical protein
MTFEETRFQRLLPTGVIAPFPRYELLKSPFPEFAFSPVREFICYKTMTY